MAVGGFELPGDHALKQIIWDVSFLGFFLIPGSGIFVGEKAVWNRFDFIRYHQR